MKALGAPHNGGRRVCLLETGKIFKPRCLFWEWLLLSKDSSFRECIEQISDGLLGCLPKLQFEFAENSHFSGQVEQLNLNEKKEAFGARESTQIGATVGLISRVGIGDLHRNNIAFGTTQTGNTIFGPIDIEWLWNRFHLVSQSHLIFSTDIENEENSGLAHLRSQQHPLSLESIAGILWGYLEFFRLANANLVKLKDSYMVSIGNCRPSVRLILRDTAIYEAWLLNRFDHIDHSENFTPAEIEQLQRGDVPYFFRHLNDNVIYYYSPDLESKVAEIPIPLSSPVMKLFQHPSQLFSEPNEHLLIKAGVLQIAKFFVHPELFESESNFEGLRLNISANQIGIKFPEMEIDVACKI